VTDSGSADPSTKERFDATERRTVPGPSTPQAGQMVAPVRCRTKPVARPQARDFDLIAGVTGQPAEWLSAS
jgi:hypothetical protein